MHTADHPPAGSRVVVLHEVLVHAEIVEQASAIGLEEEPARIPMDERLDQNRAVETGGQGAHGP